MSIFEKDFLDRVKSAKAPTKTREAVQQSENVPEQRRDTVKGLLRQARAVGRTRPRVVEPSRSSLKVSWRDDAKWLEENFPEDYAVPKTTAASRPSCGTRSSDNCEATVEPQTLASAPESTQSAPATLQAPSPIPLPNSFWQALLYGSCDALLSHSDANTALRSVASELGKDLDVIEFTVSIRFKTLRQVLSQRFGAGAWPAMNKLWRSAPGSPCVPQPSEDQSRDPPGPLPVGRNQPRWIRELNGPGGAEREWLTENGLWCG
jgi:hypothetical protein